MLSSYGRHSLPPAFQPDRNSFQSAPSSASSGLSPHTLSSLLTSHFSSASILPRPQSLTSNQETETNQPQFPASPYHPAAFASYQNSLKLKKKKHRTTKIGPDGIPLKRKSREGGTTYLWEFLLKLLQVCFEDFFIDIVYRVHIFRTKRVVPGSSSGPTGRRASSSWWTARRCPGCGGCTRTSLTWTTRPWAEPSGKHHPRHWEQSTVFLVVWQCVHVADVLKNTPWDFSGLT